MARCAAGRELANSDGPSEEPAGNSSSGRYGRDYVLAGKGLSSADRRTAAKARARQRAGAQVAPMQMNRVEIAGYVTKKPEVRHLPSGTPVASVRVGESVRHADGSGQTREL